MSIPADLPGAALVAAGIEALKRGEATVEALLVSVGSSRMRAAGLDIPSPPPLAHTPKLNSISPSETNTRGMPTPRYNALIRRLVSFERALERRMSTPESRRDLADQA